MTEIGSFAFYACASLTEVTIPDSVKTIGEEAFSACRSLTRMTFPDGVTEISARALYACASLTEVTIPDSVTTIREGAFSNCESLKTLFLPESVEYISDECFHAGLVLIVMPESYAEQYAVEHDIPYRFQLDESVAVVLITLLPQEEHFDPQGMLLALRKGDYRTSRRLTSDLKCSFGSVPIGENYTAELSNPYGDVISVIENFSIQAGVNRAEMTEFLPVTDVNARILTEEQENVTDRCGIEWIDEEGNAYASDASLRMVPVGKKLFCKIQLDEDLSRRYAVPEPAAFTVSAQETDCAVVLRPQQAEAGDAVLNLLADYTARADEGERPEPKAVDSLSGMLFDIKNLTTGATVSRYLIHGTSLFFPEHVHAGDTLAVTVSSRSDDFAPQSRTVEIERDNCADLKISLTQRGALRAVYQNGGSNAVRLLAYDSDGVLAWTGTDQKSGILQSASLPDGRYTVLAIGDSPFLTYPSRLRGIADLGLSDGKDYVSRSVSIASGKNTTAEFGVVPAFSEESFYVSDLRKTQFSLSRLKAGVGKYVTLRASAPLKPEYEGQIRDAKWIFELPQECEAVAGTLSANGEPCRRVDYAGNEMIVSSVRPGDMIRMCLMPTKKGSYTISGSLQYVLNGRTVRQPVGRLALQADEARMILPKRTMSRQVTASGTAIASSAVSLYDNGEPAGRATAGKNGQWQIDFELCQPLTYSEHDIYAEIETPAGSVFCTEAQTLVYQYAQQPVQADCVTMIYEGQTLYFDFKGKKMSGGNYSYNPAFPTFTFVTDMEGDHLEKVSNLQLSVLCSDGAVRILRPSFDKERKQWVISEAFVSQSLPQSVSVAYDYNADAVYSAEGQKEISNQWTSFFRAVQEKGSFKVPLPPDASSCPDDLLQDIETYNEAIDQLKNTVSRITDLFRYEQTETSVDIATDHMQFQSETLPVSPPVQDLLSQGYERVPTTDSSVSVFKKQAGDLDGAISNEIIIQSKDQNGADVTTRVSVRLDDIDTAGPAADQIAKVYETCGEDLLKAQKSASQLSSSTKKAIGKGYAQEFAKELYGQITDSSECLEKITKNQKFAAGLKGSGKLLGVFGFGTGVAGYWENCGTIADLLSIRNRCCKQASCNCMNPILANFYAYQMFKIFALAFSGVNIVASIAGTAVLGPVSLAGGMALGLSIASVDYFMDIYLKLEVSKLNGRCAPCEKCSEKNDSDPSFQDLYAGSVATGILDPSGFVYEAVPSNRLSDVTVSCYEKTEQPDIYGEPQEEIRLWDAGPYGQQNPLVTGADGAYAWDVPQGVWQVRCEKEGYEDASSDWMDVPPPQFDVNLGMTSYEEPSLDFVAAYPDEVVLAFHKYMRADTLTADSVCFASNGKRISGTLQPADAEASPADGAMLARRFSFAPDELLKAGESVTVEIGSGACTYSGASLSEPLPIQAVIALRPKTFTAAKKLSLDYNETGVLELSASPAEAAAGMKVSVTNPSGLLLEVSEETVTLDRNGKASVHVRGLLPGQCEVSFALNGSFLEARSEITIHNPNAGNSEPDDGQVKPSSLSICRAELEYISCVYDGLPKRPSVSVRNGASLLAAGRDYAVSYRDNARAGTAYAVVSGKGAYAGTITLPFVIRKADCAITAFDITKTVSQKKQSFSIKALCTGGGRLSYKSSSKSVKVSARGKITIAKNFIGKAVISIQAEESENYRASSKKIKILVRPVGVKISKATNRGKGKWNIQWKKSKHADGYEAQYAANKKFKGPSAKIKKIKKGSASSCVISGLKRGKAYYVRIRAYKKVSGKKYVSAWSSKKKLRKSY